MLLGSKDLIGSACVSHEERESKNDFKQSLSILIYSNFFTSFFLTRINLAFTLLSSGGARYWSPLIRRAVVQCYAVSGSLLPGLLQLDRGTERLRVYVDVHVPLQKAPANQDLSLQS